MSEATRLAEPFAAATLRTLSKGGASLTYVPAPEVIHRLNDVLGPTGWSYEVLDRWSAGERDTPSGTFPTTCMAHVRLFVTIGETTAHKDGIGGQAVKFAKEENGGAPIDLGDEWKGAVSDALKKAAQAFEVGLDLARKEDAIAAEHAEKNAAGEKEQIDAVARDQGWRDAQERYDEWTRLQTATNELPEDERASVRASVSKAKLVRISFTRENATWLANLIAVASPKSGPVEGSDSEKKT